ncbi:integral membrane protein [Rubellimicrobium mesophilum DSM 19309]|uniref:Integral membrane protein n=1 Tax=Rubellimicrobium mesophilum DSM 19309 TaxID=442562 RepID=A0A017HP35_9RHOB|nr:UbiA family prenyltransferase [Rubellimicrobium mesophilum]EYD76136.1 integral membrane protein [Rubellimicrobium mesophilum DSM 19309]
MNDRVLVIDLDGTLVRTDMLFETFWSALGRSWTAPVLALRSLLVSGRSALKAALSKAGPVEVASLPYNDEVLDYIRDWRARGGRTALVTASHQDLADQVAEHLGIFDEVHGSDDASNLKGERKATFLESRFGPGRFDYMGDAPADLPVWEKAHKAVAVGAPRSVRTRLAGLGREVEHLRAGTPALKGYLRALRPHQWLKNLLVVLPLLASHRVTPELLGAALLAFVAFSLVASSVYVLNDLLDLQADRAHPRKRNRPFASGAVPIAHGTAMAPVLMLMGFLAAVPLGGKFVLCLSAYWLATTAYSLMLKRIAVLDIVVLAGLYTLRIVAGALATGIPLSVWLLAFSVFFFFALAAVKRQAELAGQAGDAGTGLRGRGYRVGDLQLVSNMATSSGYVSVLVLALYVNSPAVLGLYSSPALLWGICLVLLFWLSRVMMLTHRGEMHDDPVVFAATDRVSQLCILLCAALGFGAVLV